MIWEGFDRFDQHVEEIVIEDYSDLMIEARRNIMGSLETVLLILLSRMQSC